MSRVNISNLCIGEELLDGRHCLVGNVAGFGATHKERRAAVLDTVGLAKRKVAHVFQRLAKNRQRDAELELRLGADEVGEEKLTDRKGLVLTERRSRYV